MLLVTIPTGDIGARVLRRLLDAGAPLRVVLRDTVTLPEGMAEAVDVVEGSHSDAATIGLALERTGKAVLRAVGLAHSPGDQIAEVPDASVTFAGDLIEEPIYPIVPFFPPLIGAEDIDMPRLRDTLATIADRAPAIIVPGHGNLGDVDLARDVDGCLVALADVAAGSTDLDTMVDGMRRRYPTWEQPDYIAPALRYLTR